MVYTDNIGAKQAAEGNWTSHYMKLKERFLAIKEKFARVEFVSMRGILISTRVCHSREIPIPIVYENDFKFTLTIFTAFVYSI